MIKKYAHFKPQKFADLERNTLLYFIQILSGDNLFIYPISINIVISD